MARTEKSMGTIVTPAGILSVTVYYDNGKITDSNHIPNASDCLLSVGNLVETPEYTAGTIEIGTFDIELIESFDNYSGGLWNKMFESDAEFRFYLDEGAGNTFYFWGLKVDSQVTFSDISIIGNSRYRTVSVSLDSMLSKLKDCSIADIITTIKANTTNIQQHTPFNGHYHDVVSVYTLFGCIYKAAFGSTDVDTTLSDTVLYEPDEYDIQFYINETGFVSGWYGLNYVYIPIRLETQGANIYSMMIEDRDQSIGGEYFWGNRFENGMELLAYLCRNFGVIPRYYYGTTTGVLSSIAGQNKHRLNIFQRGRYSNTISMGLVKESSFDNATDLKPTAYRVRLNDGTTPEKFDGFDITIDYAVYGGGLNPNADQTILLLLEDQGDSTYYLTYTNNSPYAKVFDYLTESYQEVSYYGNTFASLLQGYYQGRFSKSSRRHRVVYKGLQGTFNGGTSHQYVTPYKRGTIDDGSGGGTFFIYGISKSISDNSVELTWIEE